VSIALITKRSKN